MEKYLQIFRHYKNLGQECIKRLSDEQLLWSPAAEVNSCAVIVKHLQGNMLSRWTNFLETDGEKEWRKRDAEFEEDSPKKTEILSRWEEGWVCLFKSLSALSEKDLEKTIYIRAKGHTVEEAIHRQLAHYAYHIGQMVQLAKQMLGPNFQSLSIPKGESQSFNTESFSKGKRNEHFSKDVEK